jgi:hypothetical protein
LFWLWSIEIAEATVLSVLELKNIRLESRDPIFASVLIGIESSQIYCNLILYEDYCKKSGLLALVPSVSVSCLSFFWDFMRNEGLFCTPVEILYAKGTDPENFTF